MLQQSTYATKERWPEKSAGVLKPFGRIALIFLDFLVRFASRQNEYRSKSIILKIKFLISIFLLSTSIHTKALARKISGSRGILEHFYGENYIEPFGRIALIFLDFLVRFASGKMNTEVNQ
jgi:hypothetical protein